MLLVSEGPDILFLKHGSRILRHCWDAFKVGDKDFECAVNTEYQGIPFQAILILLFLIFDDRHLIGKKYANRVESKRNADDAFAVPRESVIRREFLVILGTE